MNPQNVRWQIEAEENTGDNEQHLGDLRLRQAVPKFLPIRSALWHCVLLVGQRFPNLYMPVDSSSDQHVQDTDHGEWYHKR